MSDRVKKQNFREEDGLEELNIDFYQIYLEEMASIPPCTEEEEKELLKVLTGTGMEPGIGTPGREADGASAKAAAKAAAKNRLIEGNLSLAVRTAEEYRDRGLPLGDLVQEANMAMLLFLEEISGGFEGNFKAEAGAKMRSALEEALTAQESERRVEEEMAARVNVLKDISAGMAKELGREPTVTELAERMKMTEDEIRDIMKLTLDAMSVSGGMAEAGPEEPAAGEEA